MPEPAPKPIDHQKLRFEENMRKSVEIKAAAVARRAAEAEAAAAAERENTQSPAGDTPDKPQERAK